MTTTYSGNSHHYLLDQLIATHPHLVEQVESGEMSPHKAAVEAGMRPRQLSMRIDDPKRLVASLRRNATPEFVAEVGRLIAEES